MLLEQQERVRERKGGREGGSEREGERARGGGAAGPAPCPAVPPPPSAAPTLAHALSSSPAPPSRAVIFAPPGTPYAGGAFAFDVLLPPDYPSSPPLVRWVGSTCRVWVGGGREGGRLVWWSGSHAAARPPQLASPGVVGGWMGGACSRALFYDTHSKGVLAAPPAALPSRRRRQVQFLTTGGGRVRFNPNLYENGKARKGGRQTCAYLQTPASASCAASCRPPAAPSTAAAPAWRALELTALQFTRAPQVCLSLLGTWAGPGWQAGQSTLLQVLISIQSMILGALKEKQKLGWLARGRAVRRQLRAASRL